MLVHLMKINKYTPLLALLFVSGSLHAQTTIPAGPLGTPGGITAPLTVQGDTTVNGTLTVQPEIISTSNVLNTPTGAGAIDPAIGAVGPTTTIVGTKLGETTGSQTQTTGGGATIGTNGDANLSAATGLQTDISFSRLTTVEIYNADQPDAGQPVPGSQLYFAAKPDPTNPGQFISISPPFTSEADLNTWINDPVNDPVTLFAAHNDLGTQAPLANTGGNLNVEGQTTTNGINNSGEQINGVADGVAADDAATVGQMNAGDDVVRDEFAAADDVVRDEFAAADDVVRDEFAAADDVVRDEFAAADAALGIRIDQEIDDRIAGDDFLDDRIDTERDASVARDNTLQSNINAEANTRALADTALGGRIDDEVAARILGDNNLNTRINTESDNSISRDNALGNRITGVQSDLANETNNRIAADNRLQSNIDQNTRGIAMVAAMTNTRVEAGKTHGVDFNMAQFQSETGFAFGYANRVNENVQVHTSVASTTDFDESVVRVGVSVQW